MVAQGGAAGAKITASPITAEGLSIILADLRDEDQREVEAILGAQFQQAVAAKFLADGSDGFIATQVTTGQPAAVFWWHQTHKGRFAVAMLARPCWRENAAGLSRLIKALLIPQLQAEGLEQATCLSLAGHRESHRWLRWLGFVRRGELPSFGIGGEAFVLFTYNV